MGMFDEIVCKRPLPISGKVDETFQSKDTPDCYLGKYEIREDGSLYKTGGAEYEDCAFHPVGKVDYTGCINFYGENIEAMVCYLNGEFQWLAEFDEASGKWVTK